MYPRLPIPISLLSLCLLVLPLSVSAERVNVTIDDTYGDAQTGVPIKYSASGWKLGQTCTDCTAHPDPTRAYDRTWHDGTYNDHNVTDGTPSIPELTATASFEGDAVYVYCILAGSDSSPDGYSSMQFELDNGQTSVFTHIPAGDDVYQYDALVFSATGLPAGIHTLKITNGATGGQKSLVLLDYIVYTRTSDATPRAISSLAQTSIIPAAGDASSSQPIIETSSTPFFATVPVSSASSVSETIITALSPAPPSPVPTATKGTGTSPNALSTAGGSPPLGKILPATLLSIFGALILVGIAGWAVQAMRRRKRNRVAPSTEYLRSAAAAEGGDVHAGVAGVGGMAGLGAPVTPLKGGWSTAGAAESPTTPVSLNTLEPLRPSSFGASAGAGVFGDDRGSEIQEVHRR
ncbi:hypothetical protein GY45DRAFT_1316380 [Cubamyces sp. BRFM 1775]|nr:hypothetical protein GY45DRAFT_1316380 [Cubamyces sp. BRFM 1775]